MVNQMVTELHAEGGEAEANAYLDLQREKARGGPCRSWEG